jgi:LmbE family N-acetylglucosaminyl deacetylase
MTQPLTLMAVHAHPDDESSSTGGVLAKYSAEGIRTIVVTCTNGELGDAPGGIKPGEEGHDPDAVSAIRLAELKVATDLLGVSQLEILGNHDSGMSDWEYKDRVDVFGSLPVEIAAAPLIALIERDRPDVLVTYCIDDGYDHPDHLQANRIALFAAEQTGIPRKVYLSAIRGSDFDVMMAKMAELGIEIPDFADEGGDWRAALAAVELRITTTIDTTAFIDTKHAALMAHTSQIEESFFAKLPPDLFAMMFAHESFIKVHDVTGGGTPEDDLFAGLR